MIKPVALSAQISRTHFNRLAVKHDKFWSTFFKIYILSTKFYNGLLCNKIFDYMCAIPRIHCILLQHILLGQNRTPVPRCRFSDGNFTLNLNIRDLEVQNKCPKEKRLRKRLIIETIQTDGLRHLTSIEFFQFMSFNEHVFPASDITDS